MKLDDGRILRFKPTNLQSAPAGKTKAAKGVSPTADTIEPESENKHAEDFTSAFKMSDKIAAEKNDDGGDLMSRIFEAEQRAVEELAAEQSAAEQSMDTHGCQEPQTKTWMEEEEEAIAAEAKAAEEVACEPDSSEAAPTSPKSTTAPPAPPAGGDPAAPTRRPRLQLSLKGLLAMRVWAIVGDPDEAEEIIDHLMDCGKTVFVVSSSSAAHFKSTAELNSNPGLPKAEVLAFVEPTEASQVRAGAEDAARLGLRGVLLHPEASDFALDTWQLCLDVDLTVHAADILTEVHPGLVF